MTIAKILTGLIILLGGGWFFVTALDMRLAKDFTPWRYKRTTWWYKIPFHIVNTIVWIIALCIGVAVCYFVGNIFV